jgi:hypothetical protein
VIEHARIASLPRKKPGSIRLANDQNEACLFAGGFIADQKRLPPAHAHDQFCTPPHPRRRSGKLGALVSGGEKLIRQAGFRGAGMNERSCAECTHAVLVGHAPCRPGLLRIWKAVDRHRSHGTLNSLGDRVAFHVYFAQGEDYGYA